MTDILQNTLELSLGAHTLVVEYDAQYYTDEPEPQSGYYGGTSIDGIEATSIILYDEDGGETCFDCVSEVPDCGILYWSDITTTNILEAMELKALDTYHEGGE